MFKSMSDQVKSSSTQLILLGVLAIIVGIIALAWPRVTILALVILFAIWASPTRCCSSCGWPAAPRRAGRRPPAAGAARRAAGIIALVWPGPTALVLVLVVAIWAFVGGFLEIFAAFQAGETAGTRALFILGGLVSILFGIVLFARPGVGAVTLALLFGLFALIYGVSQIVFGIELRHTGRTLHSIVDQAA